MGSVGTVEAWEQGMLAEGDSYGNSCDVEVCLSKKGGNDSSLKQHSTFLNFHYRPVTVSTGDVDTRKA